VLGLLQGSKNVRERDRSHILDVSRHFQNNGVLVSFLLL
jgi:hypothetical protein